MGEKVSKTTEELWNSVLDSINSDGSISKSEYTTWFAKIIPAEESEEKLIFHVGNKFTQDWVITNYKSLIENKFSELGKKINADFIVNTEVKPNTPTKTETVKEENNKETIQNQPVQKTQNPTLKPEYTFDTFVPGDNSNFAYNACLAISKNPGATYNPCLIYGGVGLGKTHLLQSIGNAICEENPKAKVIYVTAENFTNDFTTSIRDKTTQQFRNKYRKASVLLIDDIQFLERKAETQNELFNTFNDLYDTGRQLVFTCDRPIEDLKDMTDRLSSRFSKGLNIDIQPPDYETRVAIIQKKCLLQNFVLNDDVIEFIARNISSNVRILESCITKLHAYSQLLNHEITLETAKEQLKQNIFSSNDSSGITIENILKTVSSYFGISIFDLKGKSKNQSIVRARQIAMYICSQLTDNSTTQIAQEFGGKNHTTVVYTIKKVEGMMSAASSDVSGIVSKITAKIKEDFKNQNLK